MIGDLQERCKCIGTYVIENKCTVRVAAQKFGISKSTVHKDLTERLPMRDPQLYQEVRKQLNKNAAERHIRGGQATKKKLQNMRFWK